MRVIPSVTNGAQTLVLRSKDAGPDRDVTEFEIGKISVYRSVKALAVFLCFGCGGVGTRYRCRVRVQGLPSVLP